MHIPRFKSSASLAGGGTSRADALPSAENAPSGNSSDRLLTVTMAVDRTVRLIIPPSLRGLRHDPRTSACEVRSVDRLAEPFRLQSLPFSYTCPVGQLTDGTRSRLSGPISRFPDPARPPCRRRVRARVPLRCERVRSSIPTLAIRQFVFARGAGRDQMLARNVPAHTGTAIQDGASAGACAVSSSRPASTGTFLTAPGATVARPGLRVNQVRGLLALTTSSPDTWRHKPRGRAVSGSPRAWARKVPPATAGPPTLRKPVWPWKRIFGESLE